MLLSYKHVHLQAQQRLQEEGCVEDNIESMDYTHSQPSTIASLSSTTQLSPVPYTLLKTATIPTYYGISIAIPRYISMKLSPIPFIMTRFIIVILLCMIM